MCEFKIVDKKTNTKIAEEVVILAYSDERKLLLKDILGISNSLESALIYEVNTLDQTCTIIQNPLVNPFIKLLEKISEKKAQGSDIKQFQSILEEFKDRL